MYFSVTVMKNDIGFILRFHVTNHYLNEIDVGIYDPTINE